MRVLVGTSGFSYAQWKGIFYPEKLANARMLAYYAERLPSVELNNTFYRLPRESALASWRAAVPPGFSFAVKAPRAITHYAKLSPTAPALEPFLGVHGALGDRGGPVLFQLPPTHAADPALLRDFIGVLPTGEFASFSAVALILLRVLQGVSAGGEWGGAALMAVETAAVGHRNRAGAWPQLGVPFGMLLATTMLTILQSSLGQEGFRDWGWRIAFLFSIVLIVIGYLIRRAVEESPVFKQIAVAAKKQSAPIPVLVKRFPLIVLFAALVFAGDNAVGYMLVGGVVSRYASTPTEAGGVVGMNPADVSLFLNIAALSWAVFTYVGAWIADKIGAKAVITSTFALAAVSLAILPMFTSVAPMYPFIVAAGIGVIGTQVLTYGLSANYYGTASRAAGVSWVAGFGRLGGIAGPAIGGLIIGAGLGPTASFWIFAGAALVGAVATALIPRSPAQAEIVAEQAPVASKVDEPALS